MEWVNPVPIGQGEGYGASDDKVEHMQNAYRLLCQWHGAADIFCSQCRN